MAKNNGIIEKPENRKVKKLNKLSEVDSTADESVQGRSYPHQAYEDSQMKDNEYEPADTELLPRNTHYS